MDRDSYHKHILNRIVHDFNNGISTVMGYVELAESDLGENDIGPHIRNYLTEALKACSFMVDYLKKLQIIGRARGEVVFKKEYVNVSQILDRTFNSCKGRAPSNIEMISEIENDLYVKGNPEFVQTMLTNIHENSIDAMVDTGGRLTVTLKQRENENTTSEEMANAIRVEIKDTGKGIPADLLDMAFYPFLTAHDQKKGLGLAVVKSIVDGMDGKIELESSEHSGTNIRIDFPRMHSFETKNDVGDRKQYGGTETILLVDDEFMLIQALGEFLEKNGYKVLYATNGATALNKIEENKIDILVTDLQMPHMTGDVLIQKAIQTDPNIKCIVASGYSDRFNPEQLDVPFVPKPVKFKELAISVRELLDTP